MLGGRAYLHRRAPPTGCAKLWHGTREGNESGRRQRSRPPHPPPPEGPMAEGTTTAENQEAHRLVLQPVHAGPLGRTLIQVVFGGALVFAIGVVLGNAGG